MSTTQSTAAGLPTIVDDLEAEMDGGTLKVRDILSAWGSRAYGPVLLVVGLLSASPIGAIPGMSIVFGTLISVLASQLIVGRDAPWVPETIASRSFSKDVTKRSLSFLRSALERVNFLFSERLTFLATGVAERIIGVICIALALLFYPLALIPFGVFVPSMAVAILGIAITARDGVWSLIGIAIAVGGAAAGHYAWTSWGG